MKNEYQPIDLEAMMNMQSPRTSREQSRKRSTQRGFSLIELMVVIVILAAIASIVGPRLFKNVGKAKRGTARTQMAQIEAALDGFRLDVGRYPTTSEGLAALERDPGVKGWDGPYLKKAVPADPWQNPYVYVSPGSRAEFELSSYGLDGQAGGTGEAEDINSWD